MSDIVLTPTSVIPATSSVQFFQSTAGVTLSAGLVCMLDPATQRLVLASATSEESAQVRGVMVHQAATGQPACVQTAGVLDLGADLLLPGQLYVVSANAGKIAPIADLLAGQYTGMLGVALDARRLHLRLWSTGVARG